MRRDWELNRISVDRLQWFRPFSPRRRRKILFLTIKDEICEAQIFPFFLYAREIADQHDVEFRELPLHSFLAGHNPYTVKIDVVCFQTWFDLTAEKLSNLIDRIRSSWPDSKIAYLDWFAPTDLRYAETLTPHVAVYIKKQVLANFDAYDQPTRGDTNLTDYYARRFGLSLPETHFDVPGEFRDKLVLGPGFELSPRIMGLLRRTPTFENKTIDLHARMAVRGSEWYSRMRTEALEGAVELASKFNVVHSGRVSSRQFFNELRHSKLCFSPFGYGEVCWRDFEAMATGAMLLKPDMSHLRLADNIFRPYETYVPLAWDLSDLTDKLEHYLHSPKEVQEIARNAFEMLRSVYRDKIFLRHVEPLWRLADFHTLSFA